MGRPADRIGSARMGAGHVGIAVDRGATRGVQRAPPDVAYFNTAAISPQLRSVRFAGRATSRSIAAARPWEISDEDWFTDVERLRSLFARDHRRRAPRASRSCRRPATAFAVAARNLPTTHRPAGARARRGIPVGRSTPGARRRRRSGAEILTVSREAGTDLDGCRPRRALDERVAIVSVPERPLDRRRPRRPGRDRAPRTASWARGWSSTAASRSAQCRSTSASCGPTSWSRVGLQVAAGARSASATCTWPRSTARGEPLEENWAQREGSEDFARLVEYRDEYQPGARRFDVGQRTKFELTPMAIAALEQVLDWQVPRIAATLARTTSEIARRLAEPGIGRHAGGSGAAPTCSACAFPSSPARWRSRHSPHVNCFAALRGETLRISPHLHTTPEDIECLQDGLRRVTRCG